MKKRSAIHLITVDNSLAASLSLKLVQMGYAISGIELSLQAFDPVTDIKLLIIDCRKGQSYEGLDSIKLPVLYLSNNDQQQLSLSKKNKKQLYPPFNKKRLKILLDELIPSHKISDEAAQTLATNSAAPFKLDDRIFVKHKEKMVKLEIEDILYIEADRNYSRIFSTDKEYLLAITLKTMEAKLPDSAFYRIHRSYIVNLRQINEVADTHLVIARKALPISKSLRAGLLKRLQTI